MGGSFFAGCVADSKRDSGEKRANAPLKTPQEILVAHQSLVTQASKINDPTCFVNATTQALQTRKNEIQQKVDGTYWRETIDQKQLAQQTKEIDRQITSLKNRRNLTNEALRDSQVFDPFDVTNVLLMSRCFESGSEEQTQFLTSATDAFGPEILDRLASKDFLRLTGGAWEEAKNTTAQAYKGVTGSVADFGGATSRAVWGVVGFGAALYGLNGLKSKD